MVIGVPMAISLESYFSGLGRGQVEDVLDPFKGGVGEVLSWDFSLVAVARTKVPEPFVDRPQEFGSVLMVLWVELETSQTDFDCGGVDPPAKFGTSSFLGSSGATQLHASNICIPRWSETHHMASSANV